MINQLRTLLLNSRPDLDNPAPWDRYIPEDFQPLELPTYLEAIRAALVGTDGWWDRTYRVEALLECAYSVRYMEKFNWLDHRLTPPQVLPFLYSAPAFTVTRVPAVSPDVFVSYIEKPYDKPVPVNRTWQVLGSGSSMFTVVYGNGVRKSVYAYMDAALGWVLPVDVDVSLVFSDFGGAEDVWNVTSYKKPENVFAGYPALVQSLPSTYTAQLFSMSDPSDAPLADYKRWYQTCVFPEDPVMGVVLAYVLKASKLL